MKKIKVIILRTAGTNCDLETARAFSLAGAEAEIAHINMLKGKKRSLEKYHILAIPGGFTYGDDVASGKILANELRSGLGEQLARFVLSGKLIIGICNGFQVLVKMGLLPGLGGPEKFAVEATLGLNDSGRFIDRWVHIKRDMGRAGAVKCVWTETLPGVVYLPIAHAEGKFIPGSAGCLDALRSRGQIVFRYSDRRGNISESLSNPNGSVDRIAGICDPSGRILGMMPHPERHITRFEHPNWRRKDQDPAGMGAGLKIFENGVNFARGML